MQIPDPLRAALDAIRQTGGRPRLVGGCVRDWLLGLTAKDFDVEVGAIAFDELHRALAPLGSTDVVGRSFGVIKLRLGDTEYDFSLPRRESKTGAGHRGFRVHPDPTLSDAEAAARRDFTINSIAYDPFDGALIDPHHGERDLRARVLRHTSESFVEDPLRVLRAMQFAARFDLSLAPETAELCRSITDTFGELAVERVWGEWDKWAVSSIRPSRGLTVLAETGWLRHFPEVAPMRGTPQEPEWHPEGDVFAHTQHCLDALCASAAWRDAAPARRRLLSFAVLAHDFGKPLTTSYAERHGVLRWLSPGHEAAGGPLAETFLQRIGSPHDLIEPVRALVVHHLLHHQGHRSVYTDTQIRRLARRLIPATIDDLCEVMTADACGRPPLSPRDSLVLIAVLRNRAHELAVADQAPRPILLGRHLQAQGLAPGPNFKPILDTAFEAQLEGAFADEANALVWLREHLRGYLPPR
ncbi:MAG: HD domain-containing protein [Opitutae bacterium]|nr:HD domain-containing protein [Opitutae bacterium]